MIDNRRQDIATCITDITGSGVDYVVETTGSPKMHQLALDILNPHGTVALLTGEKGMALSEGRKTLGIIQGDAVPQQFIPKLIELYQKGQFPFDQIEKFYAFASVRVNADTVL